MERPGSTLTEQRPGVAIAVRGLTLRAGDRVLLNRAAARFEAGEITLIIGPSGVGKSLLLKALAGLLDSAQPEVQFAGTIEIGQRADGGTAAVGVVFQNHALFDELSPTDNVRFARAHRRWRSPRDRRPLPAPADLLAELRVPGDVRTASLSGGQRQRLAIARSLAADPDVILYDEPTTGLDAATAGQVAALIESTHTAHGQTSIIVTHDYEALAPIADRIYLLDADTRTLHEIPRANWPGLPNLLHPPPLPEPDVAELGILDRAAIAIRDTLVGTSRAAFGLAATPLRLLPLWRSIPWGMRFFLHYLRLVAGPSAWVYVAVSGAIIGFVATFFTFRYLPFRSYTEPLVIEDLLGGIGFALYRILAPLLISILVAARCGAAVASDVGGKVYGRQIDALRMLGARPGKYLGTGILYAFLIGGPLLVLIGFVAARFASQIVFAATHAHLENTMYFWDQHFTRDLAVPGQWWYRGSDWMLAKTLLCSAGMAAIAWYRGMQPKHSTRDVSRGITSTILWATLFVLVVHFGFAFYEFG
jgi:ABC-type transporter Mla maintaining outer membrane lipid asymmetry ATPase subunit MlaF/ABC-type transporter Mla maintaining outer membrane lipid asymmetry permease subunit MlaE